MPIVNIKHQEESMYGDPIGAIAFDFRKVERLKFPCTNFEETLELHKMIMTAMAKCTE